jgi:two-component system cell cycle sensor histidine kinase/response regulator CckA
LGFLRDVYGLNPAIKLLIDPATGLILDANDAAARFYGYSVEELCTQRIQQINTLAPEEVAAEMASARDGNRTFFRFKHRLASGEVRHVEVYTGPVVVEGRTCLLSIVHDVTARERALEDLARSEAQQRSLLRALPVGVGVHRAGRFIWVNQGLAAMVGRATEELVGSPIEALMPDDGRGPASSGSEVTPLHRASLACGDGRSVAVDRMELPFDFDGEPCRMLLAVDVSERARLEADLQRAQRMDAIGRVAGGVAHDFNNLLLVVLGAADMLARRPASFEHFSRNLERIREATLRAAELTKQLLLVSRGTEARGERLEVAAVVGALVDLVGGTLPEGIDVKIGVSPGLAVQMPRSSLEQVVMNLAVNARDAMPDGGKLTVDAANVILDEGYAATHLGVSPGPYVLLAVSDTGMGMDAATRARIFEPFFTTKEPGKGTGLGLSTAYGIVRRAGGAIEIESATARGTTMRVLLPIAPAAELHKTPPPPSREVGRVSGRSHTILLVDDQRAIRELLEQTLTEAGYKVFAAAGAREALVIVEQHGSTLDLLVTDVVMPKMRGPELAERVRALRPGLPVIFMSGYTGESLTLPADSSDLLEKPFAPDALLERVARKLGLAPSPPRASSGD